ncbi:MAG: bifunctional methylenetetrahydrofolate dehydrogenase/methenyltetrahydrofolate cyclohydrolase FolD [Oscillospiraceae bacterium]
MAVLIDGKSIAAKVRSELREQVTAMARELKKRPALAVIIVGEDPASQLYVRNKQRACEDVGILSEIYTLGENVSQESLEYIINSLAERKDIDGILLQLPLPKGLDAERALRCIPPEKDVDAFHPENVGHVMRGDYRFLPCTPAGVMELLSRYDIDVEGKDCVVIGRSNIVGKPMAMMLLHKGGTVTICHSKTQNLAEHTRRADILVSAVGKAGFVTADMVKEDAVVIDVGINRGADGKLCGDVDFVAVEPKAGYITPVPGGVGPMTVAMLMKNTVKAAELSRKTY